MSFGSSSSSSKPVHYQYQQDAMKDILGMSMGHLGGTQAYAPAQQQRGGFFGKLFMQTPLGRVFNRFMPQGQQQAQQPQNDIFAQLQQPYTGQFAAPMTEHEQYGLNHMLGILQGNYDPRTSDFYQGMRTQALENLQNALTGTRQAAAAGGMLASTPRIGQEAQLQRQTANDLNTLLGGMYERERDRIQQTLPLYQQAAGTEREIAQKDLDMQYQEFVRQLQMVGLPLEVALRIALWSPGQSSSSSGFNLGLGSISKTI